MASQYKTRCPHCAAQFKITDEHLKQARGAVRCGSCLQIFQASDYLIDPPANPQANSEDRWAGALEATGPDSDTSEDQQTFADDDTDADADGLSIQGMELSDSFMNLDADDASGGLGEDFTDMQGAGAASHSKNSDESWAEALLEELEDDQPSAPPSPSSTGTSSAAASSPKPEQRAASTPKPPAQKAKSVRAKSEDNSLFGGLDLFSDELYEQPTPAAKPVRERDNHFRQHRDWAGLLKWTFLSVIALMVLIGQFAFFNFDELARNPNWRPLYQQTCSALGCQLPSRSDITQVRGANLVVRSHPDYANALIVDAILFNEAKYPQPFPELELSFSALNGGPVASRRFTPEEYLQGELRNMDTMPVRTPLHISLEIVDPGDTAVNYNLRLLPAPQPREQLSLR